MAKYLDLTGLQTYDGKIKDYINERVSNPLVYRGTKTVSEVNALTSRTVGDYYNISNSGTITPGNVAVQVGDDVAWDGTKWNKLASDKNVIIDVRNQIDGTSTINNLVELIPGGFDGNNMKSALLNMGLMSLNDGINHEFGICLVSIKRVTNTPSSAVTDLTNTEWIFKNNVSATGQASFNINFASNNENYSALSYDSGTLNYVVNTGHGILDNPVYIDGTWANQSFKAIRITGGTDVTNGTLISWLQANATQQGTVANYDVNIMGADELLTCKAQTGDKTLQSTYFTSTQMQNVLNKKADLIDATSLTGNSTYSDLSALLPSATDGIQTGLVNFGSITLNPTGVPGDAVTYRLGICLVTYHNPSGSPLGNIYVNILGTNYNLHSSDVATPASTLNYLIVNENATASVTTTEINNLFA